MDFQALQTEFFAHGFDRFNDAGVGLTRAKRFINSAYQEICDLHDWPFLEASTTNTPPLNIADMRTVESVIDTTSKRKLVPIDRRDLTDYCPDLTVTGDPGYYYLTLGTTINVFPVAAHNLLVRYWRVAPDLVNNADLPAFPARYHELIVLGACRRALVDDTDSPDYQLIDTEYQRGISIMAEKLGVLQHDRPDTQSMVSFHEDM